MVKNLDMTTKKSSQTSWKIKISKQAKEDLSWFRKHNKDLYSKCFDLTLAISEDPFEGIGKPEHLKGLKGNVWSRRVNLEHRLVYEVFVGNLIVIASYRYHYPD